MTKILLMSDTHGYLDDRILAYVKEADQVWHAGDIGGFHITDTLSKIKPLAAVYGNIDDAKMRKECPLDAKFKCEEVKVWMTHIGGYPNRYDKRVRDALKRDTPNIFISGHSHILKVQWDKKLELLHLNPGACGTHGFHQMRTMLRFTIDGKDIKDLEVIELGKRGV